MNSNNVDNINYNEKSKSKSKEKTNKITKNNNSSNIHVFSTINDFLVIRDKN